MTASPPVLRTIRRFVPALVMSAAAALAVAAVTPTAALTAVMQPSAAASDTPTAAAASASVIQRPCFGAPARSPIARCVDPSLRLTVFPTPDDAVLQPNAPCLPLGQAMLVNPCAFGETSSAKQATIALIGDSHASHWRAAVDVVARAAGSRAVSITRSGCPFSQAQVVIPSHDQATSCRRWNRELLAWLGYHPEVTTIFLSQRANATYVGARGTASNFDIAVRGDAALWRALPAT